MKVFVPSIMSGDCGSRLQAKTTKTSRSSGERLRSTDPWVNVLAADSATENPMETTLEDCFRPTGIY